MPFSIYSWAVAFGSLAHIATSTPLLAAAGTALGDLMPRNFVKGQISDDDYAVFTTEYSAAQGIAQAVQGMADFDGNDYYEIFIPQDYQSEDQAKEYQQTFLQKFRDLGADTSYTVTIDRVTGVTTPCAPDSDGHVPYAATLDKTITLCDAFFTQPRTAAMSCAQDGRVLDEFETGALTILHEFTHLKPPYFSLQHSPNGPFGDSGYGSAICEELAIEEPEYAIVNADSWMFVALGAYWSDKCGWRIPVGMSTTGAYNETGTPGCLPGESNQWLVSPGNTCNANSTVSGGGSTIGGPEGCNIPVTGGTLGSNVADCKVLDQASGAVELTLAVTNRTKGYYTDYMISVFEKPNCAGQSANFTGPKSSDPLINGDYLYQTGCFGAPQGIQWNSYHVWNISAYEDLHGPIPT